MTGDAYRNGQPWQDTAGAPITAHGGGFLVHGSFIYWYGEVHTHGAGNRTGIACYRSRDLRQWEAQGLALPKEALPEIFRDTGVCERPKVLFNRATGTFVMWMHLDADGYTVAEAGVAVADRPEGPFAFVRSFRPIGHDYGYRWMDGGTPATEIDAPRLAAIDERGRGNTFRDLNLLADGEDAYVFYSSENNGTLYVARLAPDFLDVVRPAVEGRSWARALPRQNREAPAPFIHDGRYYLFTSGLTGWAPNAARLHIADHPLGPWRDAGDPCFGPSRALTFRSQSTFVLALPGTPDGTFLFCADRWEGDDLARSTYLWLPFCIPPGGIPRLEPVDAWNMTGLRADTGPEAAGRVQLEIDRTGAQKLVWAAAGSAVAYRIYCNQRYVALTAGMEYPVPAQLPGRVGAWTVVPWNLRGVGAASPPLVLHSLPARESWLDEYPPDRWQQGYGQPSARRNVLGGPLRIAGREYRRGVGTHTPSELAYDLGGGFSRLEVEVGIDDAHPGGPVIFRVIGDGNTLWSSSSLTTGEFAAASIDLQGIGELRLEVRTTNADVPEAYVLWADARLRP